MILFDLVIGLLLREVLLRIYNPLPTRVVGDSIRLLKNYERRITIQNRYQQVGLDESIYYSTNSIGFRGIEHLHIFSDYYYTISPLVGALQNAHYLITPELGLI